MKDFNSDLFDPGTTVMDSSSSDHSRSASSSDADFGFAFNDSNFSDRILRIEIMGDPVEPRPDSDTCTTIADWARHRKRRREDIKKDNSGIYIWPSLSFALFISLRIVERERLLGELFSGFRNDACCFLFYSLLSQFIF